MGEKCNVMQLSLHSVENILGSKKQVTLFEGQDKWFSKDFNVPLSGTIERFGIDLTDMQFRVMGSILRLFTGTFFRGNISPKQINDYIKEEYQGKTPSTLKYIESLPRLRLKQSELMEELGIDRSRGGDWSKAVSALNDLGEKQYCYFYDRLSCSKDGKGIKDSKGCWVMEEVSVVDTLFKIARIYDKKTGRLKFYEIIPSPIFLDQRESYFLLVPNNWRKETVKLFGTKKSSSYTFRFLLFLMHEFEKRRRRGKTEDILLEISHKYVAERIKIPESVIRRNKKRMNLILDSCYEVAKKLGYISSYVRSENKDRLVFVAKKYFHRRKVGEETQIQQTVKVEKEFSQASLGMFGLYHTKKKEIDGVYEWPEGREKAKQLLFFEKLSEKRSKEDFSSLLEWSFTRRFWGTKIASDYKKLSSDELWVEFLIGRNSSSSKNEQLIEKASIRMREVGGVLEENKDYLELIFQGDSKILNVHNGSNTEQLKNILEIEFSRIEILFSRKRKVEEKQKEVELLEKLKIEKNMAKNLCFLEEMKIDFLKNDSLHRVHICESRSDIGVFLGLDPDSFKKEINFLMERIRPRV